MVWLGYDDRAIGLNSDGDRILFRLNSTDYLAKPRAYITG